MSVPTFSAFAPLPVGYLFLMLIVLKMDGGVLKGEPKEEPAGGVTSGYINTAAL